MLRSPKPRTAGRRRAHEGLSGPSVMRVSTNDGCHPSWPSLVAHLVNYSIRIANPSPASRYAPTIHTSRNIQVDGILDANRAIERRSRPSRHVHAKHRAAGSQNAVCSPFEISSNTPCPSHRITVCAAVCLHQRRAHAAQETVFVFHRNGVAPTCGLVTSRDIQVNGILDTKRAIERRSRPSQHVHAKDRAGGS